MEKKLISIEDATDKLFDRLNKDRIGNALNELAQDLFNNCIYEVELENEIDDANLDSYEMWYDDARQEFMQTVDEMIYEILKPFNS